MLGAFGDFNHPKRLKTDLVSIHIVFFSIMDRYFRSSRGTRISGGRYLSADAAQCSLEQKLQSRAHMLR
jgi:hypothetical protein